MYSPYRFMELSVVHFMAFPQTIHGQGPIIETLEQLAKDPFFSAVEIGPINDDNVRHQAAQLLSEAHIKVGFGAQPLVLLNQLNPNSPDTNERAKALETLKPALEQAMQLGAHRVALLSGPMPANPQDKQQQLQWLIDFLCEFSESAVSLGLEGLTLETFDYDIDKKALVGSNVDAAFVASEVKKTYPDFGLMVDLSHLPLQHESIETALNVTQDHIVHAHIGNCVLKPGSPAYGDQHPRFGYPDSINGVDEVATFLQELFKIGFLSGEQRPFVGFEVKPQAGEKPEFVLANAQRIFNEAWARLNLPD